MKTLLRKDYEKVKPYRAFVEMLLEDILDYGTLADYTLRRIANLETTNSTKLKALEKELQALQKELGRDYLTPHKIKQQQIKPDIIIAIENQSL